MPISVLIAWQLVSSRIWIRPVLQVNFQNGNGMKMWLYGWYFRWEADSVRRGRPNSQHLMSWGSSHQNRISKLREKCEFFFILTHNFVEWKWKGTLGWIEPQSLATWVRIISARPSRTPDRCHILPLQGEDMSWGFSSKLGDHIGHKIMKQWIKLVTRSEKNFVP